VAYVAWKAFDVFIIDGVVNGTGKLLKNLGEGLRSTETGVVHDYLLWMAGGLVSIFVLLGIYFIV
jgi:NADH-quinone oxidoreductase subunit L